MKYPQHEKLTAHRQEIDTINRFLDSLPEEYELCELVETFYLDDRDHYTPVLDTQKSAVIAHFLGVDEDALEQEKRAMLKILQGGQ